ncbi:MAG: hypothetical protein EAZ15_09750 [Sphingobacteriales bacterium]|nr:MAG: hypothetical protein EAZ15_09750 [Sphingobacteriales bacterium]
MINHKSLVQAINKNCKSFFLPSNFQISFINGGPNDSYYYRIDGNSKAKNYNKNDSNEVNVLHWFKNFWLYVEISFKSNNTFISISVFQGTNENKKKHQLFRIEWDDYNNPEENHPQPHWHITTDNAISESFKEFTKNDVSENYQSYELAKSDVLEIKNIHFALNGNWQNNETHIHKIDSEEKIVKWFQGVLSHLRMELK